MAKSANLYARIEPEVKEQAETILAALGLTVSAAINLYYKQIIMQKGLPFDVKLPEHKMLDISTMSGEDFDKAVAEGYEDYLKGKSRPAEKVFADIYKDYGI